MKASSFKKAATLMLVVKSQVQKSIDVITCFFCIVKKQKFRSIETNSWTSSLSIVIFL